MIQRTSSYYCHTHTKLTIYKSVLELNQVTYFPYSGWNNIFHGLKMLALLFNSTDMQVFFINLTWLRYTDTILLFQCKLFEFEALSSCLKAHFIKARKTTNDIYIPPPLFFLQKSRPESVSHIRNAISIIICELHYLKQECFHNSYLFLVGIYCDKTVHKL